MNIVPVNRDQLLDFPRAAVRHLAAFVARITEIALNCLRALYHLLFDEQRPPHPMPPVEAAAPEPPPSPPVIAEGRVNLSKYFHGLDPAIQLHQDGDLFQQDTEILVNPANPTLQGNWAAGICALFYQKAGLGIFNEAVAQLPRAALQVRAGTAVLTGKGNLPDPATHVVHAVGPNFAILLGRRPGDEAAQGEWEQRKREAMQIYRQTYFNILAVAQGTGSTISIPLVSSGIFNCGVIALGELETVALLAIQGYLQDHPDHGFREIRLVLSGPHHLRFPERI